MTNEEKELAEKILEGWRGRCAADESYRKSQLEKMNKVNEIILTVGGYIQGKFECVILDKHCINCDLLCEWNVQDYEDMELHLPKEERFPWKEWLPYRAVDKPSVYFTEGKLEGRIKQKFLIKAGKRSSFPADTTRLKKKIKTDLKAMGIEVYIVTIKMLLCNRGKSAIVTVISKY